MQTLIKFTATGANSAFGAFSAGDILRCSESMAKHLVDEIKVAKYADVVKVAEAKPVAKRKAK